MIRELRKDRTIVLVEHDMDAVFELAERITVLHEGGEQQMLSIARALVRRPRLMLLDEPFVGLAATIVQNLLEVCRELAARGQTIVIVEQNVRAALSLAHRARGARSFSLARPSSCEPRRTSWIATLASEGG